MIIWGEETEPLFSIYFFMFIWDFLGFFVGGGGGAERPLRPPLNPPVLLDTRTRFRFEHILLYMYIYIYKKVWTQVLTTYEVLTLRSKHDLRFHPNNRHICSCMYHLQQLGVRRTTGNINEIFSISTFNNIKSINIKQFIQQDYLVQH